MKDSFDEDPDKCHANEETATWGNTHTETSDWWWLPVDSQLLNSTDKKETEGKFRDGALNQIMNRNWSSEIKDLFRPSSLFFADFEGKQSSLEMFWQPDMEWSPSCKKNKTEDIIPIADEYWLIDIWLRFNCRRTSFWWGTEKSKQRTLLWLKFLLIRTD